jgi:hypothetical protein
VRESGLSSEKKKIAFPPIADGLDTTSNIGKSYLQNRITVVEAILRCENRRKHSVIHDISIYPCLIICIITVITSCKHANHQ